MYPQNYYYIPSAIDKDVANIIKKQCSSNLNLVQSEIANSEENDHIIPSHNEAIRNSKVGWIPTDNWISGMMKHFVEVANNNLFHYDLNQWASHIQYTYYGGKGTHYTWHSDIQKSSFDEDNIRKLSISLLLSDSDDYEGGELQIMHMGDTGMQTIKPPIGSAIIFPSTSRHRVRPLKSGERISLVGWYGGLPFR